MHIHIPDGILPVWLWGSGYLIASIFLALALVKMRKDVKRFPLIAALSALMLVVMSIPLGIPYHLNLAVLAGFILGPFYSIVSAFIVNLILASFGHGGITIVGLNTLVLWIESMVGYYLFSALREITKNLFLRAWISTFFALMVSAFFVIFLVSISTLSPEIFLHEKLEGLKINLQTFMALTLPIATLGAILESFVTAFAINYLKKVKPKILMVR